MSKVQFPFFRRTEFIPFHAAHAASERNEFRSTWALIGIMMEGTREMQMDNETNLFTIGHSNHELERFLKLVTGAGVTALADVRSRPYSRRLPHFNRPELEAALAQHGIAYVYLGDELGGRPEDPDFYDDEGRVDYLRVRKSYLFQQGLERLGRGLERYRIALFCAEEDPLDCHRGLMIAPSLVEQGISPVHLRGNGSQETTAAMEDRLLAATRVGEGFLDGLFAAQITPEDRRRMLDEAYRLQARRKAFRLRQGDMDDDAAG
jgi:hypothetical protein